MLKLSKQRFHTLPDVNILSGMNVSIAFAQGRASLKWIDLTNMTVPNVKAPLRVMTVHVARGPIRVSFPQTTFPSLSHINLHRPRGVVHLFPKFMQCLSYFSSL